MFVWLVLCAEEEEQDQREDEGLAEPDTEFQQGQEENQEALSFCVELWVVEYLSCICAGNSRVRVCVGLWGAD